MNRDKQISEDEQIYGMVDYLSEGARSAMEDAVALYNAGYRKSTDLAREIFEEIEKKINLAIKINLDEKDELIYKGFFTCEMLSSLNSRLEVLRAVADLIAELKKKYTEGCDGQAD